MGAYFDENIPRWVRASINTHFAAKFLNRYLLIMQNDATAAVTRSADAYYEMRLNGPRLQPEAFNEFRYELEVSIICSAHLNSDLYLIDRVVGLAQSAMTTIAALKLGDGVNDDQSNFGCLVLRNDVPRPVDTIHWGQLDPSTNLTQSVVEGYYTLQL